MIEDNRHYDGSTSEVAEFLQFFKEIVGLERHRRPGNKRIEALSLVQQLLQMNRSVGAFRGVRREKLAFQLALRLYWFEFVNQGHIGFCATASLISQVARDYQLKYAQLVIDLTCSGKGRLDRLKIEPRGLVRRSFDPAFIGECDWVVLASLRNSSAVLTNDMSKYGGYLPGQLCAKLRCAGYTEIEDYIFVGASRADEWRYMLRGRPPSGPRPSGFYRARTIAQRIETLKVLVEKLRSNHNVIMSVSGEVENCIWIREPLPRNHAFWVGAAHFVYVLKLILLPSKEIEVQFSTYGRLYQGRFPLEEFASQYEGFISYNDRQLVR